MRGRTNAFSGLGSSSDIESSLSKLVETPRNLYDKPSAYFLQEGLSIEAKQ